MSRSRKRHMNALRTLNGYSEAEIKHMIGYVTDDGAIAGHFKIDRAQVATFRANIKQPKHVRFKKDRCESGDEGSGRDTHARAVTEAQTGSETLYNMTERMFERYAKRKRITAAEARTLMLNFGCVN